MQRSDFGLRVVWCFLLRVEFRGLTGWQHGWPVGYRQAPFIYEDDQKKDGLHPSIIPNFQEQWAE
jgi:hypothetical protein